MQPFRSGLTLSRRQQPVHLTGNLFAEGGHDVAARAHRESEISNREHRAVDRLCANRSTALPSRCLASFYFEIV
jgi:hypothetical protein